MSAQPPTQPYPPQQVAWQPPPTNNVGLTGFILSIGGLIACGGLLCPIGLIVSLFGLNKEPRGFAIAGVVIGLAGSLLAAGLSYGVYLAYNNSAGLFGMFGMPSGTSSEMFDASIEIDSHYDQNNAMPDEATGTSLVSIYSDEWGTPLAYKPRPNTTDYEMHSAGPDQIFGTNDDYIEVFNLHGSGTPIGQWSPTATFQATPFDTDEVEIVQEVDPAQITFTFEQAARALGGAFPQGSSIPDEATGNSVIANLRDAWGQPFEYSRSQSNPSMFVLKSAGPDGVWQNGDDIDRSYLFEATGR